MSVDQLFFFYGVQQSLISSRTSLLYPRSISVWRSVFATTPEDGMHQEETAVLLAVPASIQLLADRSSGMRISPGPTDTTDAIPVWAIFIPLGEAPTPDIIQKGDKIIDDTGTEYKVEAPYWNIMGFRIAARLFHP